MDVSFNPNINKMRNYISIWIAIATLACITVPATAMPPSPIVLLKKLTVTAPEWSSGEYFSASMYYNGAWYRGEGTHGFPLRQRKTGDSIPCPPDYLSIQVQGEYTCVVVQKIRTQSDADALNTKLQADSKYLEKQFGIAGASLSLLFPISELAKIATGIIAFKAADYVPTHRLNPGDALVVVNYAAVDWLLGGTFIYSQAYVVAGGAGNPDSVVGQTLLFMEQSGSTFYDSYDRDTYNWAINGGKKPKPSPYEL